MEYETFEDELDAIRLAIYEEIKDMTREERVAYFNSQAEPIIKEFGMQTVNLNQMKRDEQVKKETGILPQKIYPRDDRRDKREDNRECLEQ